MPDGREDPSSHAEELPGGSKAGVSLQSRWHSLLEAPLCMVRLVCRDAEPDELPRLMQEPLAHNVL